MAQAVFALSIERSISQVATGLPPSADLHCMRDAQRQIADAAATDARARLAALDQDGAALAAEAARSARTLGDLRRAVDAWARLGLLLAQEPEGGPVRTAAAVAAGYFGAHATTRWTMAEADRQPALAYPLDFQGYFVESGAALDGVEALDIADGRLDAAAPCLDARDETGQMAHALERLRQSSIGRL